MAGFENGFQSIQDAVSAQLVATTRTAGQLAAEDINFLGSSDPKAKRRLERQNRHLLDLAQRLIAGAGAGLSGPVPELKKPDQIDENWRGVVDVIDSLLERADRSLDEFSGVIKRLSGGKEEEEADGVSSGLREGKGKRIHPLSKPQLAFKHVPKNDETDTFRPLLTSKPHAIIPFEESLRPIPCASGLDDGSKEYKHPYETEIARSDYPPSTYVKSDPIPPIDDPDGKILTWVDRPEQVAEMLEDLKQAKEIAVDLEHHDQHSYVGLVCLMQISTREKDWVVDTLKPWRQDLQVLNEVFADPSILKVFHGSTSDMIWLQRDLGLYVVGLFDTYHAAVALGYPKKSLAYLLKRFANFDAQKKYQMADWRTRPLSEEMMHYARSDTHFLLNVYDNMRNELIDASSPDPNGNKIDYVLGESKQEALQRYERTFYDLEKGSGPSGWLALILRTPANLRKDQFAVFKAVHQFRDKVARRNDESLFAVMRNDTLFAIARTLPEEMPALMTCIHPVTQFVQPKLSELLNVIKKAKKAGENGPELAEIIDRPENQKLKKKFNSFRKADAQSGASSTITATSVAETLARTKEAAPVANVSGFWGAMLVNGSVHAKPGQNHSSSEASGMRLSLPVPIASSSTSIHATAPQHTESPTSIPPAPVTEPTEPSTFSIKALRTSSLKRKASEPLEAQPDSGSAGPNAPEDGDSPEETEQDYLSMNDRDRDSTSRRSKKHKPDSPDSDSTPSAEAMATYETLLSLDSKTRQSRLDADKSLKRLFRTCKKHAKALKKKAGGGGADGTARNTDGGLPYDDDDEPFDYAAAPSVLQASEGAARGGKKGGKGARGGRKGGGNGKSEYDPYAKALDTAKGLPKPRMGGHQGRSQTFARRDL